MEIVARGNEWGGGGSYIIEREKMERFLRLFLTHFLGGGSSVKREGRKDC